jgi:hypothetical protein
LKSEKTIEFYKQREGEGELGNKGDKENKAKSRT